MSALVGVLLLSVASCSDDNSTGGAQFNPAQDITVTDFYPDSGGIATPMMISGTNFGTDTTGLRVYFVDEDGIRHRSGLVSSNGEKIYCYVPAGLTYKRKIDLVVEREQGGQVYTGTAKNNFWYITQTSVTTVAGQPSTTVRPTTSGTLTTGVMGAPTFICLDDEDNIFIAERRFNAGRADDKFPQNAKGENVQGNMLRASMKTDELVVLSEGFSNAPNAPTYNDEEGNEGVYLPEDPGLNYWRYTKATGYMPRRQLAIPNEDTKTMADGSKDWKFCFVTNKIDKQIYTVMYSGALIRINPRTRTTELLLKQVSEHKVDANGAGDAFCAFSTVQPNRLFVCFKNTGEIWYVDVDKLDGVDKKTYHGVGYAGRAIKEGITAGRGWEDGLLQNAKFNYPCQITFNKNGVMYIADSFNQCIRTIDTKVSDERATVNTVIGIPGSVGFKDGGPEEALFRYPTGVAVNADGSDIYVADRGNCVVRRLSIQ